MSTHLRILPFVFLGLLTACTGDEDPAPEPDDTQNLDSGDTGPEPAPDWCAENGYSSVEFQQGPSNANYGSRATDFTLQTLDGEWSFSENWSGCDSYLFLNYAEGYDYAEQFWDIDIEDLLEASPPNVHYFFMSYDQGSEVEQVTELQEDVLDDLSDMSDEDQAHWADRLHFVTDSAWYAGSVGDTLQSRGAWAIGIDRNQILREVGYLANPSNNWEGDALGLSYEARHYNFEVERDARIAALNADAYVSFDGSATSSGYADLSLPDAETMAQYDSMHIELELGCGDPYYENCGEWDYLIYAYVCDEPLDPTAGSDTECQPYVAEVLGTCLVDGEVTETSCSTDEDCLVDEEYEAVSCEGYTAAIAADTQACDCDAPDGSQSEMSQSCNDEGTGFDECSCSCSTEIGRWITSYARDGHWIMDASPALAFLRDGGDRTIRFQSSYSYENTLTFHLSNQDRGGRPDEVHYLYSGGSYNETYNDNYESMLIDIPEDATRVELYAVISGHGWGSEVENCAEFCNHTHHFTVNGEEFVKTHEEAGAAEGCIDQIDIGTVPNQFGTWPYGRGGWCPGMQVDPWIVDVTDAVTPGEAAAISYQSLFEGDEPYVPEASNSGQGFGANINMNSYLVISR